MTTVDVIFDGKAFVPTTAVDLPLGVKCVVILKDEAILRPALTSAEAERILEGDGKTLPWATVEEALAHPRYSS